MRRRLIQLGLFILAGAIVNVAVAWGCVHFAGTSADAKKWARVGESDSQLWHEHAPVCLNRLEPIIRTSETFRFALRERRLLYGDFTMRRPWDADASHVLEARGRLVEAGWPAKSLTGECWSWKNWPLTSKPSSTNTVAHAAILLDYESGSFLPLHSIWPGFAINTLFFAGILWLLFAAPFALRRRRRIKRGLCPACAYPVGDSEVCTECGRPHTVKPKEMAA